jgi:tRNA (guanine37-N1)-methyltransferase
MGLKTLHGAVLPVQNAQNALEVLKKMQLSLEGYEFRRAEGSITIPLVRRPSPQEEAILRREIGSFQIQQVPFEPVLSLPKKLHDAVHGRIPNHLISMLPRSFDVIGDVAVLELPPALEPYSVELGNGILGVNPHVRLVAKKLGEVTGKFRTRKLQVLAGSGSMETIHYEFSCRYSLDVSSVYFNPRLSHERLRVAQQVRDNEVVVDMFAGVGPYSVLIAKLQPNSRVYSIDINPSAMKYLKENIFANKVVDHVVPMLGDAREFSKVKVHNVADRVIMNLPSEAEKYLDVALQILKKEGGLIHFYQFTQRDTAVDTIKNSFRSSIEAESRHVKSFSFCKTIREISPSEVQIAIDAVIA